MGELLHQLCGASDHELSSVIKFAQTEVDSRLEHTDVISESASDWAVARIPSRPRGTGVSTLPIQVVGMRDNRRKRAA